MRHALFPPAAAPLALLALLAWTTSSLQSPPGASQPPTQDEAPAAGGTDEGGAGSSRELPLLRLKRLQREKQLQQLKGAWQLHSFLVNGTPVPPDEIAGNALFGDSFMVIAIHAVGYEEDTGEETELAQAGIFRYSIDDRSNLQTLTVIGHATPRGNIRYEPVGGLREYQITVSPSQIELRHQSGTVLTFVRMEPAVLSVQEIARLGRAMNAARGNAAPEPEAGGEEPAAEGSSLVGSLDPFHQHQKAQRDELAEQMLGPWYLAGYMDEGVPLSDEEIRGAALICDGYMGLVIHALEYADELGEEIHLAQAGIFRYRLTGSSMLQTSTVIGHSNPIDGVDYEVEGGLRQYEVSIEDEALILRGLDGTALRFVRMNPREFTEYETSLFQLYSRSDHLVNDDDDEVEEE